MNEYVCQFLMLKIKCTGGGCLYRLAVHALCQPTQCISAMGFLGAEELLETAGKAIASEMFE